MKDTSRVIAYRGRHIRYSWLTRKLGLAKARPVHRAPIIWTW